MLPKIESQSIIVAQETEEEEVAKSVPEYRPRSEGQRKEKADDDKEQEYQKWLLESNRARNFLSQHANLGSELFPFRCSLQMLLKLSAFVESI